MKQQQQEWANQQKQEMHNKYETQQAIKNNEMQQENQRNNPYRIR